MKLPAIPMPRPDRPIGAKRLLRKHYRGCATPVKRGIYTLPIEILGEIFVLCLDNDAKDGIPRPNLLNAHAPLLLCQVSAQWRAIALSLPTLWATFYSCPMSNQLVGYRSLMETWLGRSGDYPLTFEVSAPPERDGILEDTFPLFLANAGRWYNIRFHLFKSVFEQFLSVSPGSAPVLRKLQLHLSSDCTLEQINRLPNVLHRFPELRQLTITTSWAPSWINIPWSQMTRVFLHCPLASDQAIAILDQCTNLVDCTLLDIREPTKAIVHCDIVLHNLIRLELHSYGELRDIITCLTCPALRNLGIFHNPPPGLGSLRTLEVFLNRSSCHLETLMLDDDEASEDAMINFISLPFIQSITTLELCAAYVGDKGLQALTFPADGGKTKALLPCLTTLILTLSVFCATDNTFADMVASRLKPPTQQTCIVGLSSLQTVDVTFSKLNLHFGQAPTMSHECDVRRCEGFRESGLRITWRTSRGY